MLILPRIGFVGEYFKLLMGKCVNLQINFEDLI